MIFVSAVDRDTEQEDVEQLACNGAWQAQHEVYETIE